MLQAKKEEEVKVLKAKQEVVVLARSSCFQALRCSAASSSPMKPELRLLERDFPFSASYLGSFDRGDYVTFSARRGPLEAVDLEA